MDFKQQCATKIRTGFIGAISEIEQSFGLLWGHDKPDSQLTENERKWLKLWKRVRGRILGNGNDQIRKLEKELDRYEIKYKGYNYQLPVRRNDV